MTSATFTMQTAVKPTSRFLEDVWLGLARAPKIISPKYLYDERGSQLFEAICELDEYYPTRTETRILARIVPALAELIAEDTLVIEFGSGSGQKIRTLLSATPAITGYMPIDISHEALRGAAAELKASWPNLTIHAVWGDYMTLSTLPQLGGRSYQNRLIFFPGSTIGNLDDAEARDLLWRSRRMLGPNDMMLIGFDLVKDRAVLEAAYNDAKGVTAAFNRNLLARMNRELDADFDLDAFEHRAYYNEGKRRIEMHLVCRRDLVAHVGGRPFYFEKGESIHTESSRKFSIGDFRKLAQSAGYGLKAVWTDENGLFAVALITPNVRLASRSPT